MKTHAVEYFRTPKGGVAHIRLTHIHPALAWHYWGGICQANDPNWCWSRYPERVPLEQPSLPLCEYCAGTLDGLGSLREWAVSVAVEVFLGFHFDGAEALEKMFCDAVAAGIEMAEAELVEWHKPER